MGRRITSPAFSDCGALLVRNRSHNAHAVLLDDEGCVEGGGEDEDATVTLARVSRCGGAGRLGSVLVSSWLIRASKVGPRPAAKVRWAAPTPRRGRSPRRARIPRQRCPRSWPA